MMSTFHPLSAPYSTSNPHELGNWRVIKPSRVGRTEYPDPTSGRGGRAVEILLGSRGKVYGSSTGSGSQPPGIVVHVGPYDSASLIDATSGSFPVHSLCAWT